MGGMGFCRNLMGFRGGCLILFRVRMLGGLVSVLQLRMGVGSEERRIGLVWGCLLKTLLRLILPGFAQCMELLRIG